MRGGGTGDWGPKYEAIGETSSCQKQKEMQRKNLAFPIQSELFDGLQNWDGINTKKTGTV